MQPYYEQDGITIYHADCRDVLPSLPPACVSDVLTDPPYGIGFAYGTGYQDTLTGYRDMLYPILEMAEARIAPGGTVGVFQAAKYAREWGEWFPRPWRLLALPKKFVQMLPVAVQWSTDYVLWWTVPGERAWRPTENNRDWYVSTSSLLGRQSHGIQGHPCPRPLDTMRYLIECFVPPDGLVLDPFMGSGSTLRAALDCGRKAIGIEIEERYCEIAANRLRQMVLPLDVTA